MSNITALIIATITKYTACVKGFTTRINTLTLACQNVTQEIEKAEKRQKNLWERIRTVESYLKKEVKGSVRYKESREGLNELWARDKAMSKELRDLRESIRPTTTALENAKKSLETSKQKLAEAKLELKEAQKKIEAERLAEEAKAERIAAKTEAKRVADEKAARKTAKHAANRAKHRAAKEARRIARENPEANVATTKNDEFVLPKEALVLANDLGADVSDPADREILLSLINENQASA